MSLEDVLKEEWKNARSTFHYPELPHARLSKDIPNGQINMENLQVEVNPEFVEGLEDKGIALDDAMNEILTHELTHYMKFPGSFLTTLKMHKIAKEYVDEKQAAILRTLFCEAQVNLYQLNELECTHTAQLRSIFAQDEEDPLDPLTHTMYGLYQQASGQDMSIELGDSEQDLVDKLTPLKFTDKKRETYTFRKFINIMKPYLDELEQEGQLEDCGCPQTGIFSDNEVADGLGEFADICNSPEEFEEIAKEVLGEIYDEEEAKSAMGEEGEDEGEYISSGAGTERRRGLISRNIYTALAERYTPPIKAKPLHKDGSLFPHTRDEFSIGDTMSALDPFSSPGILPGITKKVVYKEAETFTSADSIPDSIILIDNSGSMPNPNEVVSVPVLAGTAIANAYLKNGAKVAVYNFGGHDYLSGFATDKERIHRDLRRYTGAGTIIKERFVEELLGQCDEADVSIISDMEIQNTSEFVRMISDMPSVHRVHLIHNKDNEEARDLRREFADKENIGMIPLYSKRDIEKITMGELTKSIPHSYER
jgi:hypothetical protein